MRCGTLLNTEEKANANISQTNCSMKRRGRNITELILPSQYYPNIKIG